MKEEYDFNELYSSAKKEGMTTEGEYIDLFANVARGHYKLLLTKVFKYLPKKVKKDIISRKSSLCLITDEGNLYIKGANYHYIIDFSEDITKKSVNKVKGPFRY